MVVALVGVGVHSSSEDPVPALHCSSGAWRAFACLGQTFVGFSSPSSTSGTYCEISITVLELYQLMPEGVVRMLC